MIEDVGGGNDTFYGDEGDDELYGGDGNDTLYGGADEDELYGEDDDDILEGGAGDDKLEGGAGNDEYVFDIGDGSDEITDSDGISDTIRIGSGFTASDTNFTQIGSDLKITFDGSPSDEILINDYATSGKVENILFDDELISNPSAGSYNIINGTSSGNGLTGTAGKDLINGFQGNDTLRGEGGDDILNGGSGFITLFGGDGNDTLNAQEATGSTKLHDGYGDDTVNGGSTADVFYNSPGVDFYDGGGSNDTLLADDQNASALSFGLIPVTQGLVVNLASGVVSNDGFGDTGTITNVENITGSSFGDTLTAIDTGSGTGSRLFARGGDDTINGGS